MVTNSNQQHIMANNNPLLMKVRNDVTCFLNNYPQLIRNERHLQVELARFLLGKACYGMVHTEYLVPVSELVVRKPFNSKEEFPWKSVLNYIDIVVEIDGKFVLIELKYPTTEVQSSKLNPPFTLFGMPLQTNTRVLANQGAKPHVCYRYWKDVRRIEVVKQRFPNVVGGLAIMLTNDPTFLKAPIKSANYTYFSVHQGRTLQGQVTLDWLKPKSKMTGSHPKFIIDGSYSCDWHPVNYQGVGFNYLILNV